MGQNISHAVSESYMDGSRQTDEQVIQEWYSEVEIPGYNFDKSGYQAGTAQFTALVWYDTTHVGMARSASGDVVVANYFPCGNWSEKENFRANVLPLKATYSWRPRNDFERALAEHFRQIARDVGSEPLVVPTEELVEKLGQIGEAKLADAIAHCDLDRNGLIDIREFTTAVCSLRHSDSSNGPVEEHLGRIIGFVGIDSNGDGKLSEEEFVRYLTRLASTRFSRERALEILSEFDKDNDGHLDYEEFIVMQDSDALEGPNFTLVAERWDELEHRLKDVPLKPIIDKLKKHLKTSGSAKVTRTETSIVVKLNFRSGGGKPEVLEGVWGDRASQRVGTPTAIGTSRRGLGAPTSPSSSSTPAASSKGRRSAKEKAASAKTWAPTKA